MYYKNNQLSEICVEKLRLRAYIGFMDWEQQKLQDLVISFSFKYDVQQAAESDNVKDAVDYKKLTKGIVQLVDNQKFNLIEYVAESVYCFIQNYHPKIEDIRVKLEKPFALRFSDNVLVKIADKDRYKPAIIALGSNIEPDKNFDLALHHLLKVGKIIQRTAFIKTPPLKFENQPDFLNGAVLILTKKSLSELKSELKQIEVFMGRVRGENKNAPRIIDLDVLTYHHFIIDEDIYELPFLIDFIKHLQPEIEVK